MDRCLTKHMTELGLERSNGMHGGRFVVGALGEDQRPHALLATVRRHSHMLRRSEFEPACLSTRLEVFDV
jgi:hypothetical protein